MTDAEAEKLIIELTTKMAERLIGNESGIISAAISNLAAGYAFTLSYMSGETPEDVLMVILMDAKDIIDQNAGQTGIWVGKRPQ